MTDLKTMTLMGLADLHSHCHKTNQPDDESRAELARRQRILDAADMLAAAVVLHAPNAHGLPMLAEALSAYTAAKETP